MGIFSFTDMNGYFNFYYGWLDDIDYPLSVFAGKERAKSMLLSLVEKYELCQKLTGLYETAGACFHYHVGVCRGACCGKELPDTYNERARKAAEEFVFTRRNFFIIDKGRDDDERSAIKVVNGKLDSGISILMKWDSADSSS
jgi:DNA polymerase-3 subunit epsilon